VSIMSSILVHCTLQTHLGAVVFNGDLPVVICVLLLLKILKRGIDMNQKASLAAVV